MDEKIEARWLRTLNKLGAERDAFNRIMDDAVRTMIAKGDHEGANAVRRAWKLVGDRLADRHEEVNASFIRSLSDQA